MTKEVQVQLCFPDTKPYLTHLYFSPSQLMIKHQRWNGSLDWRGEDQGRSSTKQSWKLDGAQGLTLMFEKVFSKIFNVEKKKPNTSFIFKDNWVPLSTDSMAVLKQVPFHSCGKGLKSHVSPPVSRLSLTRHHRLGLGRWRVWLCQQNQSKGFTQIIFYSAPWVLFLGNQTIRCHRTSDRKHSAIDLQGL